MGGSRLLFRTLRAHDHPLGDRTDFVVGSSSIRASFFASFCVRCPRDDHLMLENA
jgi:hypothetical protein